MSRSMSNSGGCSLGLQDGEVVKTLVDPRGGPEIRVRALRPTSHPEAADVVEATYRELLRRFDVEVSTRRPLREMASTWLLVAEGPGNGGPYVGGIRVDLRDAMHPIPLERALAPFGEEPLALLRRRFVGQVGEMAGLWVREDYRKFDLSRALIAASITAARRAGVTRFFAFPPRHSRHMIQGEGFHVRRELGDAGEFVWPNERNRCAVMELDLMPGAVERPYHGYEAVQAYEEVAR